ncbi:MAG TPA: M56 family metallopeptidase [Candidatus Bathyarchaeia archaeon]|nr:M56 family metallopeptidase [Candidatus Bathyarchaeia archaeon]
MSILNAVSEGWWSWVFDSSWQSGVVGLVFLGVVWGLRRMPAPLRYGLLVVGLLKFAVPPVIGFSVSIPGWMAAGPGATVVADSTAVPAPQKPVAPVAEFAQMQPVYEPAGQTGVPQSTPQGQRTATSARQTDLSAAAAPIETSGSGAASLTGSVAATPDPAIHRGGLWVFSWRSWFFLVHGAGAVVVLCFLARCFLRLWRVTRSCRAVEAGPLRDRFEGLKARLGVRGEVELLVTPGDSSAMALGIFRRRVLLPASLLDGLSGGQIDSILAHELAHHRRKDTWFIMAENILLALWWFHPVFWLVLRSLRSAREDCCDDRLLESGIADDESYCESLLRAAATVRRPDLARAALGFADQFHPLGRRLRRIMDVSIKRRPGLSAVSVVGLVLLALCVAPGIRMVAAPPEAAVQAVPVPPARLLEGLVAWYPFGGDARDCSGLHTGDNDGILLGMPALTADRFGNPDAAYHFNGKNQSIVVPNHGFINIHGKTSMTVGAWIRPEATAGTRAIVWKWGPAEREDDQYRLGLVDGRAMFGLSSLAESVTGTWVAVNEWSSVAGVYDSAAERLRLYVNGALVQEKPCGGKLRSTAIQLSIGGGDSPEQYFGGDIDEVRIYNRALSDDEIAALYGPGAADQPLAAQQPAAATPMPPSTAIEEVPGELIFDGSYRHGERGEARMAVKREEDGSMTAISEMPFSGSTELARGRQDKGVTHYEIKGDGYFIAMDFEPGKAIVTRKGVREDWDRKEFEVPADAFFDPNARPDSYCAAQVYARILPPIAQGQTQEFNVYDWDNTGNAFAFYRISMTNAGPETVDVPAGKFEATHIVVRQLSSANTWFKKRAGHITDFWMLSDNTIMRILRHREPYELQLMGTTVPAELPSRLGPPAPVAPVTSLPKPPPPSVEELKQVLSTPAPDTFNQAPGNVTLNALYRHKSRRQTIDIPEHRWVKTTPDGSTVTAACDLAFMKHQYVAVGGPQQGFTRYEAHAQAEGGGPGYQLVMEFEPGKVFVTRKGVREDWDRKEFEAPLGALFDPNTRPDPYLALQVLERVITVGGGGSLEFDAYDWDNTGDAFGFYKMKVTNAGYEEVTVPCGRFNATHVVLEQLTSADTWFKKRAGHVTDVWLLADGTLVRVLRHREPYEMELLDWQTPETLPGLIERTVPQPPTRPGEVQREPIAEADKIRGCWSARGFTMPYDAVLYMTPVQGEAGGMTELGIGNSRDDCKIVFRQLPNSPQPTGEVKIGEFKKGDVIPFCMKTSFGEDFWVSTREDSEAARVAFQDADGKLGLDDGSILEQIAPDKWLLHLDDANSYKYDDDDNDIPIVIRLKKIE